MDEGLPPGPAEKFGSSDDLLQWLAVHRESYGDIYRASVVGRNVYVVSRPAYVDHVLRGNWENYARRGQVVKRISLLLGNGLIASNGSFWVSQRRMIQPAFTRTAVAGLLDVIKGVNEDLLAHWQRAALAGTAVNVTRDVSTAVLKITLLCIFGDDYDAVAEFCNVLAEDSARNMGFAQAFQPLGEMVVRIAMRRRRANAPGRDILGTLLQARDRDRGQPMSDVQLARETMTLIVAGHETTATALNWIWYLLSRHPGVEARLGEELHQRAGTGVPPLETFRKLSYTVKVIDEALRLYPPLWLMTRHAINADRLGGYFVPAGTEIYISPYLIQHDPGLWQMPDRFDPDRVDNDPNDADRTDAHAAERAPLSACPFGAGPRNCIGEFLARTEMQVHLMIIGRDLRLQYDDPRPAEMVAGMNLLSKGDFLMSPQLRSKVAEDEPHAHLHEQRVADVGGRELR